MAQGPQHFPHRGKSLVSMALLGTVRSRWTRACWGLVDQGCRLRASPCAPRQLVLPTCRVPSWRAHRRSGLPSPMWRAVHLRNSYFHHHQNPGRNNACLQNRRRAAQHHLLQRPSKPQNLQPKRPPANALSRILPPTLFSVCFLVKLDLHSVVCYVSIRKLVRQWANCCGVDVAEAALLRWRRAKSVAVRGIENQRATTRTVTTMRNTTKNLGTLGSQASIPVRSRSHLHMCMFVSQRTGRPARSYFSEFSDAEEGMEKRRHQRQSVSSTASRCPRGSMDTGDRSVLHYRSWGGVYHPAVTMLLIYLDMCFPWVIQRWQLPTAPARYLVGRIIFPLCSLLMFHLPFSLSCSRCLFYFVLLPQPLAIFIIIPQLLLLSSFSLCRYILHLFRVLH